MVDVARLVNQYVEIPRILKVLNRDKTKQKLILSEVFEYLSECFLSSLCFHLSIVFILEHLIVTITVSSFLVISLDRYFELIDLLLENDIFAILADIICESTDESLLVSHSLMNFLALFSFSILHLPDFLDPIMFLGIYCF